MRLAIWVLSIPEPVMLGVIRKVYWIVVLRGLYRVSPLFRRLPQAKEVKQIPGIATAGWASLGIPWMPARSMLQKHTRFRAVPGGRETLYRIKSTLKQGHGASKTSRKITERKSRGRAAFTKDRLEAIGAAFQAFGGMAP